MPRGGKRLGAGRPRSQPPALAPLFDILETIEELPDDAAGRRRRSALALAAYGATDGEIAAAIGGDLSMIEADVRRGRIILEANVRAEIMAHATAARGRPWRISAAKWALKYLDLARSVGRTRGSAT